MFDIYYPRQIFFHTSFPSTAFVRMTADDTGGGIHPTTSRLNEVIITS